MSDTKTKPVLFADERSDAERFDPNLHRGHLDPSRIPGYSEIVQANDIAKADDLQFREANLGVTKEDMYRKIGATPQPLDVEFQWLPISGTAGGESSHVRRQLDSYTHQQGFRIATEEDLLSRGYGLPPVARIAEDGTIRRGPDVALYMRDGEVARKWEAYKFAEQARFEGSRPEGYTAGAYQAPAYNPEDTHEEVIVKH